MEYILVFTVGLLFGLVIMALMATTEINDLQEESKNAETRALTHFRKLYKIENIIRKSIKDKTPSVIVVDKIKEVIASDQTNQ